MRKIAELKLLNAIGYFANEHYKRTGKFLSQTQLFKYLAFLDFWAVKERGRPVIGLKYLAMQWGPVPEELYSKFKEVKGTEIFETFKVIRNTDNLRGRQWIEIAPLEGKKPNLKLFSEYERKLMEKLIEIFADKFVKGKHMSEASHQSIRAWEIAWKKAQKEGKGKYPMSFKDELAGVKNREELLERLETFEFLMGD